MTAHEIALTAVKALERKKGQAIKCLETGHLTTLADYFVLCTATSITQIKALADVCEKHKIKIVFCIFKSLLQKFVYDCFY